MRTKGFVISYPIGSLQSILHSAEILFFQLSNSKRDGLSVDGIEPSRSYERFDSIRARLIEVKASGGPVRFDRNQIELIRSSVQFDGQEFDCLM